MSRKELIQEIKAYTIKHTAVAFHNMKSLNGKDITFSYEEDSNNIEVTIEILTPKYREIISTIEDLTIETLQEVSSIINKHV